MCHGELNMHNRCNRCEPGALTGEEKELEMLHVQIFDGQDGGL